MEFTDINIWAIIVTWFINCAVGAFWYSPAGFARQWKEYTGVDILTIPQKEATLILGYAVLSGLVQALTLAVIIHSLGITEGNDGFIAGLVLWFGFVLSTTIGATLYARKSWKLIALNSGYFLIVMTLNAVILSIWS